MKKIVIYIFILLFLLTDTAWSKNYRRIVSLAPSVTESLYELGVEQSVVGITVYCPKGLIKKEIVGTLLEPNIEKIILLNPDLIILTKEGNIKATAEKFKYLGFEVYIMETAESFNGICVNYFYLAKKLNKAKNGKRIVDTTRCLLREIYNKLKDFNELGVFWEIGTRPLFTLGKQSFINDYSYYTRTINVYSDFNVRYFTVDIEDVIKRNPDIILIANVDGVNNNGEIIRWSKYKMIKAVKNNKVFVINVDNNYMFKPTPLKFAESVAILIKTIRENIFNDK
ncbi:MAG: helical backbone metal receptor [Endomicrobium sp.]|jgi:iron complex transport system substrate-binding protein|nr:helical backbone metal receptor [Endomicrobium sp.]